MTQEFEEKNKIFAELLLRYPVLKQCSRELEDAYDLLERRYLKGGVLYVAGNGGSAADSEHIVGELMKSFMAKRVLKEEEQKRYAELFGQEGKLLAVSLEQGLPAVSLPSLTALLTAVSNDLGGQYIYAQALNSLTKENDIFMGISTSGNSLNIVEALRVAKVKNIASIGLTGKSRCKMDELCNVVVHVPETETYKVQELHLPVYHALCAMLESAFFGR